MHTRICFEAKGLTLKREVDHEIQLLLDSALPNIGLNKEHVIEESVVKKLLQQLLE